MKQEDRIVIGSIVRVSFVISQLIPEAVVIGYPGNTGDAWKLMTPDGQISYVQMYERMERIDEVR